MTFLSNLPLCPGYQKRHNDILMHNCRNFKFSGKFKKRLFIQIITKHGLKLLNYSALKALILILGLVYFNDFVGDWRKATFYLAITGEDISTISSN